MYVNYIVGLINQKHFLLNRLRQQDIHISKQDVSLRVIVISSRLSCRPM